MSCWGVGRTGMFECDGIDGGSTAASVETVLAWNEGGNRMRKLNSPRIEKIAFVIRNAIFFSLPKIMFMMV